MRHVHIAPRAAATVGSVVRQSIVRGHQHARVVGARKPRIPEREVPVTRSKMASGLNLQPQEHKAFYRLLGKNMHTHGVYTRSTRDGRNNEGKCNVYVGNLARHPTFPEHILYWWDLFTFVVMHGCFKFFFLYMLHYAVAFCMA